MSVAVVSKKKTGSVCGKCSHTLTDDEIEKKECSECGSDEIKKSLTIVRKAVGDEDDDLDAAVVEDQEDDSDEDEDEEEDEEDESDEDELEDENEDEEDEEEEEEKQPVLAKSAKSLRALEVFNLMTACAEDVVKALDEGDETAYEETMVELNNVLDTAVEKWQKGKNITKAADAAGHISTIRDRVGAVTGKEKKVAKKETKKGTKATTITKREDLPEDVQKSLREADRIVEENEVKKWDEVAKNYSHLPGDKKELAKTLRTLSDADPKAFAELKKTLDTAQEQLETSDIFKSLGSSGGNEQPDESGVDMTEVKKIAKAENISEEQAKVRLMDGKAYQPTA